MSGSAAKGLEVEFLWWQGCPSWEQALAELREQMAALDLDAACIEVIEMASDAQAEREHFVGSPTIRVSGIDIQEPAERPSGLTCRVYRLRDGRVSALPDPEDVRDALLHGLGGTR